MNFTQFWKIFAILAAMKINTAFNMDGNVHVLTASNTSSFLDNNKYALVYGYVPNCDICKQVDGFIQNLSVKVDDLAGVKVGKIDISSNIDVQKILRASYLPYISLFINNIQKTYEGELDETDIYNWIKQLVDQEPIINTISTKAEYSDFMASHLAVGMKYPESDEKAASILEAFAKIYPDFKFYKLIGEAADQIKSRYEFLMVRKFDDGDKALNGVNMPELPMMQQFFELFKRPYIIKLDESIANEIQKTRWPTILIFDKDYNTPVIEKINNDAFGYRQRAMLLKSNLKETGVEHMLSLFDITEDQFPAIAIMDYKGGNLRKFRALNKDATSIKNFIESYFKDELELYIKSEPIPTGYNAVKIVVRDNFDQIVKDKTKHVMIGFYTDSCGYCSELHEAFQKAQAELKGDNDDIVFAKMNIDKNDIDINISGIPAIFLYKKNDKENPVEYSLIREWDVVLDWLEQKLDRRNIYNKPMPEQIKKQQPENIKASENTEFENIEEL